ncbi:MAG: SH3 domain-containing protein [Clostridiales bacterium]|nr:SH3 domain-containing protein [Clostridiales bacterium]
MRKYLFLLLVLSVAVLSGCKKEEQMPDFIPTNLLEDNTDNNGEDANTPEDNSQADDKVSEDGDTTLPEDGSDNDSDDSKDAQPVVVGKTTTMYVKLNQFGGYLNVRPTPSTEGAPVGFLVHAEAVEVIEIKDGWASILYKGNICYVNDDYLVDKQPPYLEPPTATPKPTATPTPKPAAEDGTAPVEEELPDEI